MSSPIKPKKTEQKSANKLASLIIIHALTNKAKHKFVYQSSKTIQKPDNIFHYLLPTEPNLRLIQELSR